MKSIVYVPQAFSAILNFSSASCYGIHGLYTDKFSISNILICIGKSQITLMHIDISTHASLILETIKKIDKTSQLFIIYREKLGQFILVVLKKLLRENLPELEILTKEVSEDIKGIFASLQENILHVLHPQIKLCFDREQPSNLIHHPYEQSILTVLKIEEVIGLRTQFESNHRRHRPFVIFDGYNWESVNEQYFSINMIDIDTQEEMLSFGKTDSYIVLAYKLRKVMADSKKPALIMNTMQSFIVPIAFYLESYLHNYDFDILFKRNLKEILLQESHSPFFFSLADESFKQALCLLFNNPQVEIVEIINLVNAYSTTAHQTKFKYQFTTEFKTFLQHYLDRQYYYNLFFLYEKKIRQALDLESEALMLYDNKSFEAATQAYYHVLKIFSRYYTKAEPKLTAIYYNLGICLYQSNHFEDAIRFLAKCLHYRLHYTLQKKDNDVALIQIMLTQAESKLKGNAGIANHQAIPLKRQKMDLMADEFEMALNHLTHYFFKNKKMANWTISPIEHLKGKHRGHMVYFFNLPSEQKAQTNAFLDIIKQNGFQAEASTAKEEISIMVDLTLSKAI